MGHFSQTCLLSRLPITGGTPIRVCLLVASPYGRHNRFGEDWSFMSIPFRAEYNDYGNIEKVHPEDQFLEDLAVAQVQRHLVEIPWGNNLCHDVPVTRTMDADGLWEALSEDRLRVHQQPGYVRVTRVKVPKGVPTWRRVQKFLDKATTAGTLIPTSTCDRLAYGMVRVRFHPWHKGSVWEQRGEWVAKVRPVLETRYKVVERYEYGPERHQETLEKSPDGAKAAPYDVWFEVSPREGPYPPLSPFPGIRQNQLMKACEHTHGELRREATSLAVSWAFIREDVWQALLPLGGMKGDWDNLSRSVGVTEQALKGISEAIKASRPLTDQERQARREALAGLEPHVKRILGEFSNRDPAIMVSSSLEHSIPYIKSTPPFVSGMAEQVADLSQQIAHEKLEASLAERAARAIGEYAVVREIMCVGCIPVIPTYGGPQDGAWEAQGAIQRVLGAVVAAVVKERTDDRETDDEP